MPEAPQTVPAEEVLSLPEGLLDAKNITDHGQTVEVGLAGTWELVKISEAQGHVWGVPISILTPNPKQPRRDFDEAKMAGTEESIRTKGQKVPMNAVAIRKTGTNEIRLLIIDGERRYKILTKINDRPANVIIKYVATRLELLLTSLISNEERVGHNPIERARSYEEAIRLLTEAGETNATATLAKSLGKSPGYIHFYLKLLATLAKLPPQIKQLVEKLIVSGRMQTTGALELERAGGKIGVDHLVKAVRLLVAKAERGDAGDDVGDEEITLTKGGKITAASIRQAVHAALMAGKKPAEAEGLVAAQAVSNFISKITGAEKATQAVLDVPEAAAVEMLRKLKATPEALLDVIVELGARLRSVFKLVEKSIRQPSLPVIPGKPSFADFIGQKNVRDFGNNAMRHRMAEALAKASDRDGGDVMTAQELAKTASVDMQTVTNNLVRLGSDLMKLGILLEYHDVRKKDTRGKYEVVRAYRLAWLMPSSSRPNPAASPQPLVARPPAAPISAAPILTAPAASASIPTAAPSAPAPAPAPAPARVELPSTHVQYKLTKDGAQRLARYANSTFVLVKNFRGTIGQGQVRVRVTQGHDIGGELTLFKNELKSISTTATETAPPRNAPAADETRAPAAASAAPTVAPGAATAAPMSWDQESIKTPDGQEIYVLDITKAGSKAEAALTGQQVIIVPISHPRYQTYSRVLREGEIIVRIINQRTGLPDGQFLKTRGDVLRLKVHGEKLLPPPKDSFGSDTMEKRRPERPRAVDGRALVDDPDLLRVQGNGTPPSRDERENVFFLKPAAAQTINDLPPGTARKLPPGHQKVRKLNPGPGYVVIEFEKPKAEGGDRFFVVRERDLMKT